jgi:hypothetical protein
VAQNGRYWDDVVLNITGGYKAIIPIMSIIGQIRKLPTYYIFGGEEEKNLIIAATKKTNIHENHVNRYFIGYTFSLLKKRNIVPIVSLRIVVYKDPR